MLNKIKLPQLAVAELEFRIGLDEVLGQASSNREWWEIDPNYQTGRLANTEWFLNGSCIPLGAAPWCPTIASRGCASLYIGCSECQHNQYEREVVCTNGHADSRRGSLRRKSYRHSAADAAGVGVYGGGRFGGVSRHLQTRGMAATVPLASLRHLICTHQHRQTFGSQLVGHAVLAPMPPLGGLLQSASLSLSSFFCPAWLCYGSWRTSRLVVSMFAEGLGRHPAWHSYVLLASWHHALD